MIGDKILSSFATMDKNFYMPISFRDYLWQDSRNPKYMKNLSPQNEK